MQTITNSIQCLGPSPPTFWGQFEWSAVGASLWGAGSVEITHQIGKLISDTITGSTANMFGVSHRISDQAIESDSGVLFGVSHRISDQTLTFSFETDSEQLLDGSGYYYVFPYPTTEAEDRGIPTYTQVTVSAAVYTTVADTSTVWS